RDEPYSPARRGYTTDRTPTPRRWPFHTHRGSSRAQTDSGHWDRHAETPPGGTCRRWTTRSPPRTTFGAEAAESPCSAPGTDGTRHDRRNQRTRCPVPPP